MVQVIKSSSRGAADFGWLKANYSFSFSDYYNPERIRFGLLRVLNDDYITLAEGFGTHPHNDMEIITVILEGKLAHKDSAGHEHISGPNGIQVMSAGTGIYHSEYSASETEMTNSLQIWVLPDRTGHKPRYDQSTIEETKIKNEFYLFVGPDDSSANLNIHQDAYFSMVEINSAELFYKKYKSENGVYMFVIEGSPEIEGNKLERRDAISFIGKNNVKMSDKNISRVLVMEVPLMNGE